MPHLADGDHAVLFYKVNCTAYVPCRTNHFLHH
jgi:hypothetical protein